MYSMFQTLNVTLTHYSQLMGCNFIYLDLSLPHAVHGQIPHLEKLGLSINRLQSTLEKLPLSGHTIDRTLLHDIRNELSVISTRGQLLRVKSATELGSGSSQYLQNILTACDLFIKAVKTNEEYATS
jgi:hypothetical protein